jgi:membrane-bound metal-dependent hydrolase YbcI (DUF457 family)
VRLHIPFTPFHLGPALLLGEVSEKRINMAAIMLGSIIVDVRAAYCLCTGCLPLHGPLHTYLGATLLALPVIIGIHYLGNPLAKLTSRLRLRQDCSLASITTGSIIGTWVHVLLDSFLYTEMSPLWTAGGNPFYGMPGSFSVYLLCIACFIAGGFIYCYKIFR